MNRNYGELSEILQYIDRYRYLRLGATLGEATFGYNRHINQALYTSYNWKLARENVIIRDAGCDLGVPGHEIHDRIVVHHMNPVTVEDIETEASNVYSLSNLICTSVTTHRAIHYGNENLLSTTIVERFANDHCPWIKKLGGSYV